MHNQTDPLWEWSIFWQSNQLHSCMPATFNQSPVHLNQIWQNFFDSLDAGATILDMGTGNGSLITQAAKVSGNKAEPFTLHGVDLASIDPFRYVASTSQLLGEVHFHPDTAMETLPFDEPLFDAVVSQYALEYSNVNESVAEAVRVLKPGGWVRFLLHADDGVLKQRCRQQYDQTRIILDSKLFSATANLLDALFKAEAGHDKQAVRRAENRIWQVKSVFDELENRFANEEERTLVDNLFAAVRRLPSMRKMHTLETLTKMNDDVRLLLLAQSRRLQAMQQAALTDSEAKEIAGHLQQLNMEYVSLEQATENADTQCLGYWLSAQKPVTQDK